MAYADKILTCLDCGAQFVFSAADQEFHASKGFTNEPKRCLSCRSRRRAERGSNGEATGRPQREMFAAVCANCGREAMVPFRPRGDRPVYCSTCYAQLNAGASPAPRRESPEEKE